MLQSAMTPDRKAKKMAYIHESLRLQNDYKHINKTAHQKARLRSMVNHQKQEEHYLDVQAQEAPQN